MGGSDLAARKSERLEDPLVAECRLLVEFFFFTRVARLLALLAGGPIVGHKLVKPLIKPMAYPPVLIRVNAVYYRAFPGVSMTLAAIRRSESTSSIK